MTTSNTIGNTTTIIPTQNTMTITHTKDTVLSTLTGHGDNTNARNTVLSTTTGHGDNKHTTNTHERIRHHHNRRNKQHKSDHKTQKAIMIINTIM